MYELLFLDPSEQDGLCRVIGRLAGEEEARVPQRVQRRAAVGRGEAVADPEPRGEACEVESACA